MAFAIGSQAFRTGETIPKKFTGDGEDVSPALAWTNPPTGTKSFVLICDDPDCPSGTYTHWVVYDIPSGQASLPEKVPPQAALQGGMKQGLNTGRGIGYMGPSPPPGKPHRYFFRLYALGGALNLPPGATKEAVLKAMEGRVLGQAEFHGTYGRKR